MEVNFLKCSCDEHPNMRNVKLMILNNLVVLFLTSPSNPRFLENLSRLLFISITIYILFVLVNPRILGFI